MCQIFRKQMGIMIGLSILFSMFVLYVIGTDLFLIKFLISFLIGIAFIDSIYYAYRGELFGEDNARKISTIKPMVAVVLLLIIVYGPLITQSSFFHDDYINFTGEWGGHHFFEFTFSQGRQATGILTDLMNYVTVDTSWHLRIFAISGLIIYALILFHIVYNLTESFEKAIIISIMFSIITPIINVVSYGSMFCYSLAFCFSTMGILHLKKALEVSKFIKVYHLILGGIGIIVANFVYQATATVAFSIILLIYLMNTSQKENRFFPIKASGLFIINTGIYYILVKIFLLFNNSGLMSRGSIVSSIQEIINKIVWFKDVIYESIKQLISSIVGAEAFLSPWMHYLLFYRKAKVEFLLGGIVVLLLILGSIKIYKKYKWLGIFQTGLLVVLSYYVFLVLKESSYTSYYAVALCTSLLLIILYGVEFLSNKLKEWPKNRVCVALSKANIILYITCFIMCLNGNYYIRNFWIGYNFEQYDILKQEIITNYQGQPRIHVIGTLYPGQADVYASSAARIACKEIGINVDNLIFTSSSNSEYIESLSLPIYKQMMNQLSSKEKDFLERVYLIDTAFGVCTLQKEILDTEDYKKLTNIFNKTGIIPKEDIRDILVVSLPDR